MRCELSRTTDRLTTGLIGFAFLLCLSVAAPVHSAFAAERSGHELRAVGTHSTASGDLIAEITDAVERVPTRFTVSTAAATQSDAHRSVQFELKQGDVLAFVGGEDVAVAQHTGHLEALLALKYRGLGVRFRNFGWEGDTVHAQPRDVGFPPLLTHLQRARASVIAIQFGRAEALAGRERLSSFVRDYQKLLDTCAQQTRRLVLVTPPPFEKGDRLLPDLSQRNSDLGEFAKAIRDIARERGLPLIDVFAELGGASHREPRLTDNGLQLTARGHAFVARAFARQLGFAKAADAAGEADANGMWPQPGYEQLRLAIVAKNRLWFDYWRPQNWAFLGGDRTTQPSSRDHRNPSVRWFPDEMQKFLPLIEARESEIAALAEKIH